MNLTLNNYELKLLDSFIRELNIILLRRETYGINNKNLLLKIKDKIVNLRIFLNKYPIINNYHKIVIDEFVILYKYIESDNIIYVSHIFYSNNNLNIN